MSLFAFFCRWRLVFSLKIWNWLSPYWNKCFFTMIMVLIVLFLGEQSAVSDRHWIKLSRCCQRRHQSCFCAPCLLSDAVREVQKYSGPEPMQDAKVNPNVYDHVHMKLFRAQRNLYISGFSLFLWLLVSFLSTLILNSRISKYKHNFTIPHNPLSNSLSEILSCLFFYRFLSFPVLWTHHSIMRRVVTLLNQIAVTMENSAGLQAQMDSAVKAAKQHEDDNLMLKQVIRD